MNTILDNIKIVLCDTSHTGNIGSVARAMKTMGLYHLILVNPKVLPDDHSIALSCNASDVVKNAKIVNTLEAAISDSVLAVALTARKREFAQNLKTAKEIVPEVFEMVNSHQKVSFVFGAEKTGLTIEQLERCNRLVTIPGNPEYSSLNLAQAVQIICYELYSNYNSDLTYLKTILNPASIGDINGIAEHLYRILDIVNYNYKNQEMTKRRLQHLLHKTNLEREEVDLIRGIMKKIEARLNICDG